MQNGGGIRFKVLKNEWVCEYAACVRERKHRLRMVLELPE